MLSIPWKQKQLKIQRCCVNQLCDCFDCCLNPIENSKMVVFKKKKIISGLWWLWHIVGGWGTGRAGDLWPLGTNVSATSEGYSCEPVTLTVWSMGRRHTGHWRDEKFHLLSLGQVGCSWVTGKERRRRRKKRQRTRNREWSGHLCLSPCPPLSCLYGGLNSQIPGCTSVMLLQVHYSG